MATQTQYYNLDKPSYEEVADIEIINANMDKIDTQMRNNADGVNFAKAISSDAYDNSKLYAVGDYCIYDNKLYRCITAIESAEAFNIAKWEQTTIVKEVKQLNNNLGAYDINENATSSYSKSNGFAIEWLKMCKATKGTYKLSYTINGSTGNTSEIALGKAIDDKSLYCNIGLISDGIYEQIINITSDTDVYIMAYTNGSFTISNIKFTLQNIANEVGNLKNDLGGLSFSVSGTTLSITDGTNTWTLSN